MAIPSALSAYLARISDPKKNRVLTRLEEQRIFLELRGAIDPEKSQIKKEIIGHNLRLVVHFCKQYQSPHGVPLPLEDLIQAGFFGLNRAIDLFDPLRGTKFSTYAKYWIRCFLDEEVVKNYAPGGVRIQNKVLQARNRLHRDLLSLTHNKGRALTPQEIQEILGKNATLSQVRAASCRFISSDAPISEDSTLVDLIPAPETTEIPDTYDLIADALEDAGRFAGIQSGIMDGARSYLEGNLSKENLKCWKTMIRAFRKNELSLEIIQTRVTAP